MLHYIKFMWQALFDVHFSHACINLKDLRVQADMPGIEPTSLHSSYSSPKKTSVTFNFAVVWQALLFKATYIIFFHTHTRGVQRLAQGIKPTTQRLMVESLSHLSHNLPSVSPFSYNFRFPLLLNVVGSNYCTSD